MDFRNKYLKYKPEITFDIFQDVWNKLISFGYRPLNDSTCIKRYNEFKMGCCFLKTTRDHPMEFSCYYGVVDFYSETTVQEILGYDPFVKDDDFVLPERWCCKITEESIDVFNNWRISISKSYLQKNIDKKYLYITNDGSCNCTTLGDEISFDQFKKHVLKQDVEENIKINYYKCIKSDFPELVLGKLYPSHDGKLVKIPHGEYTSYFNVNDGSLFELSNKSAFDAQNQPKQPIKQYEFKSTEDKYMEVLRKNARTLGGEVAEIYKFSESVKNMFDFGAKNVDDNLRNSIAHGDVTLQNLSKSVINYGLNDKNKVLSIDDDELPMVSAIKTNTIKQLLSND